jgi:hypothetical protein
MGEQSNQIACGANQELRGGHIDRIPIDASHRLKEEATSVRFLTVDVALVDMTVVITGATSAPVLRERGTIVYVKRNGEWMAAAIRATRIQ